MRGTASLSGARIAVVVDIGFGDSVEPGLQTIDYPTLLDLPAPRLRAYAPETVIAEKFQAMVALGRAILSGSAGASLVPYTGTSGRALSSFEEAVRTLRNSILLTDFDRRIRSLLVTSSAPSEGKSTTAANLANMSTDLHNAFYGKVASNPGFAGVAPVGDAFQRAVNDGFAKGSGFYKADGTYDESTASPINLWWLDRTHPSKYGSYLSALVLFQTITGRNPLSLGPDERAAADLGIASDVAVRLQRIAQETVAPDTVAPTTVATANPPANADGSNTALAGSFTTFTPVGGVLIPHTDTLYHTYSYNVSTLTAGAVNDQSTLYFQFCFSTESGNNAHGNDTLIDNIQVTGEGVPVPEPTTAISGVLAVVGLCWYQRRWLIRSLRLRPA